MGSSSCTKTYLRLPPSSALSLITASPVVPLPAKKSRIISSSLLFILTRYFIKEVGFGLENTPSRFRFFNSFPASSLVPTFPFCLFTKLAGFKILLFFLIYLIEKSSLLTTKVVPSDISSSKKSCFHFSLP